MKYIAGCEIDDTTIRLINAFNSERKRDAQVRFVFNIKRNELCNWVSDLLVGGGGMVLAGRFSTNILYELIIIKDSDNWNRMLWQLRNKQVICEYFFLF